MVKPAYIDVHCHLHEFNDKKIAEMLEKIDILVVAVSDDLESSIRTLKLAREYPDRIIACVGLHPWSVGEIQEPVSQAREIVRLALREGVKCLGEIGLDTKFVPRTIEVQRKVFRVLLEVAKEADDVVYNLHTAGTWEEVYKLILESGVKRAIFHWYTGPKHLIQLLRESGYFISINPALKIQKKHQEIVSVAPLDMMLTESDGPYDYRGLRLEPTLIPEVINLIASIKNIDSSIVAKAVVENAKRLFQL